ncbi:MAG: T9SS type A sorting domain-containing protein [Bacteroidetes bacterium]|nr:T9SS type A sorting domain-containing protein [Bacteroidota bacterium]
MKRKFLLSFASIFISLTGFSTVWTVSNAGSTFSPPTITIQLGDTVTFVIAGSHDAREVSQSTWNANSSTALPGGFQVPFGGGSLMPAQLPVGTHFYVCTNHVGGGMKGTIIVQNTTGVVENTSQATISVSPNPSQGKFQMIVSSNAPLVNGRVEVYDVTGKSIYQSESLSKKFDIDLTNQAKGTYFVKFYNSETTLTKKIILE